MLWQGLKGGVYMPSGWREVTGKGAGACCGPWQQ